MRNDIFTLPELQFVGGQSNSFIWRMWRKNKSPYNAAGCKGNFSILDYSQQSDDYVLSKDLTFEISSDDGTMNAARVNLKPSETVNLHGRYIYQITIVDPHNDVEIPGQGIVYIANNVNKSYLSNID